MDFSDARTIALRPKIGTCEDVYAFLYMPIECPDGKSYWLQKMKVKRCYDVPTIFSGIVEYDSCKEQK